MKKAVALILTLVVVFSIYSVCFAESAVEKYTKLLTDYTWNLKTFGGTSQARYFPGFNLYMKSVHLPSSDIVVTGDESGAVYIIYHQSDYSNTAIGQITFSADYNTMMVVVDNAFSNTYFVYTR